MREESIIHQRGEVAIPTGRVSGARCGIADHGYFESLFKQIPQV